MNSFFRELIKARKLIYFYYTKPFNQKRIIALKIHEENLIILKKLDEFKQQNNPTK
jgi:hypothetical protein